MNNIIVIAYNGKKPTQQQIEAIAQHLTTLRCCDEVEIIQHYDKKSIVDIVGKGTTIIGFEQESKKDVALSNASKFINAHFNSPWAMISAVGEARSTTIRSADQQTLLNAIDIIAQRSSEECLQCGISNVMYNACYNIRYHILDM